MLISQVSKLIAIKDKIVFPLQQEEDEEPPSPERGEGGDSDELESGDSDSDHSQQTQSKKKKSKKKTKKIVPKRESTVVDDKFFKLRDMEAFLEQEERERGDDSSGDESIDLFDEALSDEEEDEDEVKVRKCI